MRRTPAGRGLQGPADAVAPLRQVHGLATAGTVGPDLGRLSCSARETPSRHFLASATVKV